MNHLAEPPQIVAKADRLRSRTPTRTRPRLGLSARIYASFLVAALVPAMIAGLVGIHYSIQALRTETLANLVSEVDSRARSLGRFVDQLSSELRYLAGTSSVRSFASVGGFPGEGSLLRARIERDFSVFAATYPYIYQIRILDGGGREQVRVDRVQDRVEVVPVDGLQDKALRYYVREALAVAPGSIYVSRVDLNVEHGVVEQPERPVVRVATPISDRQGNSRGILIVNLHADFVLGDIRQMAETRGGEAFLFDRSGQFLHWSSGQADPRFRMQPVTEGVMPMDPESHWKLLAGEHGTASSGGRIVAFSPVSTAAGGVDGEDPLRWSIALAFPESRLYASAVNLYPLYGVLGLALALSAAAGFLLSRRLLRPLSRLKREAQEIARGQFGNRVEVSGNDEIADFGASFNLMAERVEDMVGRLSRRQQELEELVAERTLEIAMQRQNLDTVLQNTADGIVAVGDDGAVELVNHSALELLDMSRDQALHARAMHLLPKVAPLLVPGLVSRRIGFKRRGRHLDAIAAGVPMPDGSTKYVIALRDLSEERSLQDARRELDRQVFQAEKVVTLGELAMGIAHEIGNPLAGMKAVVQALLDESGVDDHHRTYLGRLEKEIDRLAGFVRPFQGFSADFDFRPVAVNLAEVVEDVMLWTRKEARGQGIDIAYENGTGGEVLLQADANQLKQVLLNLAINAIHAMPGGGSLRIVAAVGESDRVRIVVQDTGSGIPAEVLPRVFDMFYTTRRDGTGIGLAVVRRIVNDHGASIDIASEAGSGTRVTLDWPRAGAIVVTRH